MSVKKIVMTLRIADLPLEKAAPGATVSKCSRCQEDVSLSRSTVETVEGEYTLVCLQCLTREEKILAFSTGMENFNEVQQAELEKVCGPGSVEEVRSKFDQITKMLLSKHAGGDKSGIYQEQVEPLLDRVHAICKENQMLMVACVHIGNGLHASTGILDPAFGKSNVMSMLGAICAPEGIDDPVVDAYYDGMKAAAEKWAVWRDGEQWVGCGNKTLKQVLVELDEERERVQATQKSFAEALDESGKTGGGGDEHDAD
jgi:hypothetical protein